MIQVYADGGLVYDSRLDGNELEGLTVTSGLNVGGTASLVMPLGHSAYNAFTGHKTVVTIYRDGELRFRGRALYPADTFYGQRTITCEGELCFLRDTINRPYLYEASPRSCFVTILNAHNAATDPWKQFKVGEVTVTDPNDYIRLESQSAETTLATLNKLVERCGGYVTFTTNEAGERVINWLASLDYKSDQVIEFGENLLDFSTTGANTTSLATAIIPYGAQLEEKDANGTTVKSGKRLTIESVNGGKDYLLAQDAIDVRGTIYATATWDDVTEPANLLKKAQAYLAESKVFITSLELTALDLSYMDKAMDSFTVGDLVRVISTPHGVNEDFQLSQMTEDLLLPEKSRIILGKDVLSLTGASVAGDYRGQSDLEAVKVAVKNDFTYAEDQIAANVTKQVSGQIAATETSVLKKVSEGYATKAELTAHETQAAQTYAKKSEIPSVPDMSGYATAAALDAEVQARAGVINKVGGVVNISGGAPVKILGGKVEIDGSEIHLGKEARFLNGSGVRIADKDGNFYYVLRVDEANSCVVGNDYTNLYLRGKEGVYLYKGGAAVTSDRREKNSIQELPDAYEALLDGLTPRRFKYNGKGDRFHVGFVAQEVDEALAAAGLTRDDFGGFVDLKGDGSELALVYDEFIGLLLQKIRGLENRLKTLEDKQ